MTLTPGKVVLAKDYIHGPADPDVAAYIAAVETADGQGLEEEVKVAYSNFITGCKADGIWNAIKASCILAGARTLSGALVPLVGTAPTNNGPFLAADYDRKTGLVGDGSSKYLDSNRNNNVDPQNSKHLAVYVSSRGAADPQHLLAAGWYGTAGNASVFYSGSFGGRVNVIADPGGSIVTGISSTPTFVAAIRTASNAQTVRTGGTEASNSFSSTTPANENVLVFAGPAVQRLYSTARIAFYSIGEALDLALLDTRVSTLISDLGAAIP
jgi:hypothetical protein